MEKQEMMKLFSALKIIDKKITVQNKAIAELDARIKRIEAQNAKIGQLCESNAGGGAAASSGGASAGGDLGEIDDRLKSIEEKSAKMIELIRSNAGGGGKKRAWPP